MPSLLSAQNIALPPSLKDIDPEIGVSLFYKNLRDSSELKLNETVELPSASIIKIPIILSLYRSFEKKELHPKMVYTLNVEDKVGGAGDIQYQNPGKKYTLEQLAHEMIRTSDNTATNVLIDFLGMDNINDFLKDNGFEITRLRRKMMDFEAVLNKKENTTSAQETGRMLDAIYHYSILRKRSSKAILKHLMACEDSTTFPALLIRKPIAHKTGTLQYIRGDAGIFYHSNPFILVAFIRNFESLEQAEIILARFAKELWDMH